MSPWLTIALQGVQVGPTVSGFDLASTAKRPQSGLAYRTP